MSTVATKELRDSEEYIEYLIDVLWETTHNNAGLQDTYFGWQEYKDDSDSIDQVDEEVLKAGLRISHYAIDKKHRLTHGMRIFDMASLISGDVGKAMVSALSESGVAASMRGVHGCKVDDWAQEAIDEAEMAVVEVARLMCLEQLS